MVAPPALVTHRHAAAVLTCTLRPCYEWREGVCLWCVCVCLSLFPVWIGGRIRAAQRGGQPERLQQLAGGGRTVWNDISPGQSLTSHGGEPWRVPQDALLQLDEASVANPPRVHFTRGNQNLEQVW